MSKATLSDDIQEASKILKKTIAHLDVKIEEHSDVKHVGAVRKQLV